MTLLSCFNVSQHCHCVDLRSEWCIKNQLVLHDNQTLQSIPLNQEEPYHQLVIKELKPWRLPFNYLGRVALSITLSNLASHLRENVQFATNEWEHSH